METESEKTTTSKKKACACCGEEYDDSISTCPFDGTKLTTLSQQLKPGTVLSDRFEIIDSVAGGGMGTVYKARHTLMKRIVAIKTMQPYLVASGGMLKRFQQEAQALSSLNHPHILSVFDFFVGDDGLPYLVMDYLVGTNLAELVNKSGPLNWQRAVRIFSDVCSGLGHAHSNGIIHRDVKPSNVMLINFDDKEDFVKVIDFGIAKVSGAEGEPTAGLTATGDTFGSPQYMSPEQCRAKKLDARSDIYSFGCVMYAALTGNPPFAGGDSMECMYRHVHEKPQPFLESLKIPKRLEAIVFKCLNKEPEDRWQSMSELRAALDELLQETNANAAVSQALSAIAGIGEKGLSQSAVNRLTERIDASNHSGGNLKPDAAEVTASDSLVQSALLQGMKLNRNRLIIGLVAAGVIIGIGFKAINGPANTGGSPVVATGPPPAPTIPAPVAASSGTQSAESVAAINAQVQQRQYRPIDPAVLYQQYLAVGLNAYKVNDMRNARLYINAAHELASRSFGRTDARYIDSLEWQGKVAFKAGQYQEALSAINYVIYARKLHASARSGLAESEAFEREIKKRLKI